MSLIPPFRTLSGPSRSGTPVRLLDQWLVCQFWRTLALGKGTWYMTLQLPLISGRLIVSVLKLLYLMFTAMVIPQALAQNFATLLVVRAIAGFVGGVLQNVLEQVAAEIWTTEKERNLPITIYTFVYVSGVTLGPVLGAIVHDLSWRW